MPITHSKVATLPDQPGVEINKGEWNDDHVGSLPLTAFETPVAVTLTDGVIDVTGLHHVQITASSGASTNRLIGITGGVDQQVVIIQWRDPTISGTPRLANDTSGTGVVSNIFTADGTDQVVFYFGYAFAFYEASTMHWSVWSAQAEHDQLVSATGATAQVVVIDESAEPGIIFRDVNGLDTAKVSDRVELKRSLQLADKFMWIETITADKLTLNNSPSFIALAGEGGLADDLVSIGNGRKFGDVLYVMAADDTVDITLKHDAAAGTAGEKLYLSGGVDLVLTSQKQIAHFLYVESAPTVGLGWVQVG